MATTRREFEIGQRFEELERYERHGYPFGGGAENALAMVVSTSETPK